MGDRVRYGSQRDELLRSMFLSAARTVDPLLTGEKLIRFGFVTSSRSANCQLV